MLKAVLQLCSTPFAVSTYFPSADALPASQLLPFFSAHAAHFDVLLLKALFRRGLLNNHATGAIPDSLGWAVPGIRRMAHLMEVWTQLTKMLQPKLPPYVWMPHLAAVAPHASLAWLRSPNIKMHSRQHHLRLEPYCR